MATEIASAYINLQTKMPHVSSDIARALGAPATQRVADTQGRSLGQKLMKGVGVTALAGAATVAAGMVATLGAAFTKGFSRLNQIDVAQAKLRGLGHDAGTVDQIMSDALASVRGTAFGLGEAATVAAQAVAAGIQPGKDLEGVLSTVANSAAAAGTDMGTMGSIFAKAMSQANGVQNDVLNQLADRGIPIFQALADQMGVTSGEVFKLASQGKIDFETFAAAAKAASGTVAQEMGGTVSGSLANLGASLGRIGANLLSGAFPQIAPTIQSITAAMEPLEAIAEKVGEQVGRVLAPAFEWLRNTLSGGFDLGQFANIASYFSPLGVMFKALQPVLPTLGKAVADLGAVLLDLVRQVFPALLPVMQTLVGFLTDIFKAIVPIVQQVVSALAPAFKAFTPLIMMVLNIISPLVNILVAIFTPILQVLATVIQAVLTPVLEILTGVLQVVSDTIAWLAENAFPALIAAGEWLGETFGPVFEAIGDIFKWLYDVIINPIVTGIVNAFRLVGAIASWLWVNAIKPAFKAIGDIIKWVWDTIINPVFNFIGGALDVLGAAFTWIYENIVKPVWDGISNAIQSAWDWIDKHVFSPFKEGIDLLGQAFELVAKTIGDAWDGIKKAAAAPINWVLDVVWNNGLRSFWNDMVGTLGLDDMKLPKADLVKFASGGVLPGFTPGRDVHEFYSPTGGRLALSGGEAIMRPEFTRLVGGKAGVDALNAAARRGELPIGDGLGSFFGDVWDNISRAASVAWEFITNPAGAIKEHVIQGIIRPLTADQNLFGKTVGGIAENTLMGFVDLFKAAAPETRGTKGMGWQAMWNVVKNAIPGAIMTGGYRSPSRNAAVGGAKGSYHMQGRAIDLIPANMSMFNQVARLFPNASELIYTPAGSRQLLNGRPFNGWSARVRKQHYNHIHLAMANGGVVPKLYDQGGWLPHGGVAVNRSGKPEPVLTNDQWAALRSGGLRPGDRVVIEVEGAPLTGVVKRAIGESFRSPTAAFAASR